MPDRMTPEQRHDCMASIHSEDTRPEQAVRRELWHRGYRFRKCVRTLPGTPDIVLPKYRTCIFVNGCFWHGHKGCSKFVMPKTRTEFWANKIARNQERDLVNIQRLESIGWSAITVWECELSKSGIENTMEKIESMLADFRRIVGRPHAFALRFAPMHHAHRHSLGKTALQGGWAFACTVRQGCEVRILWKKECK